MELVIKKIRRYLPQIAFGCAVLWLFWQIYPIIFATHDDMRNFTLVRRGILFSDALRAAKTGRISHLWNHMLLGIPFLAKKVWVYKLIQFSALLFDIYAGWKLLRTHADAKLADLSAIFAVSFACISAYHNLLIAYALCHQLPIGFCFLSLYYFGNSLKQHDRRSKILSCVFFLLALMIYEAFAAMILLFAMWSLSIRTKKPLPFLQWLKRSAKRFLPQTAVLAGYCIIYFTWQQFYPPQYDGLAFTLREPFMSLYSVKEYALSFFPLTELMRLAKEEPVTWARFGSKLLHPAAWLSAGLTAAGFMKLLPHIKIRTEKLRDLLIFTGIGMFLPCILIACSEKYIGWMRRGTIGYLPSFYSYLFLVVFLAALAVLLWRTAPTANRKKVLRWFFTGCVFCISLTATAVTQMWKPHFSELSLRYRNFDYAISTFLPDCGSNEQLYAPDNAGIHLDRAFTEDYLKIYQPSGGVAYIHEAKDLYADRKTICMRMPDNYAYAVFGEMDSDFRTTELTFRTLVPESFNITLYDTDGEAVYYHDVKNGNLLSLPEGKYFDMTVQVANTPA